MDNSVGIKQATDRRVGISEGEIVVLDKTSEGLYHGHVRECDELTSDMKTALKKLA